MDMYKLNFTILELEVLSFLSLKAGERLSQRELAKALDVSPTAIATSVRKLRTKELVCIDKIKTINFVSYNRNNSYALQLKKLENQRFVYLSGLSEFLEEKLAGATTILFGSYAYGEDTTTSDIDIAVIGRKRKALDLERFETILVRKVNINFYTSWKDIHKHLKNSILNGIVLCGSVDL